MPKNFEGCWRINWFFSLDQEEYVYLAGFHYIFNFVCVTLTRYKSIFYNQNMKRLIIQIFFFSFILFGCISNQKIINKEYDFERMYSDNHIFSFGLYLENINNPKKIQKLINELIYNGKNFDEYREYTEQKFINDTIINSYPRVINEDGTVYIYNSELIGSHSITFHDDQFVIFENKVWFYASGAAHGNSLIEYYIIDLLEKKILDKNDLLNRVPDIILVENIAKEYNTNNSLRSDIWPPDTINFHNGVVELIWNTYSILPYVDGIINIKLENEIVEQYLTKRGKELLIRTNKK